MFDLTILKNIAEHFDPAKTTIIQIPVGRKEWELHLNDKGTVTIVTVPLFLCFGMMVGYDTKLDILVFSRIER